jgi:hypothetical protein
MASLNAAAPRLQPILKVAAASPTSQALKKSSLHTTPKRFDMEA